MTHFFTGKRLESIPPIHLEMDFLTSKMEVESKEKVRHLENSSCAFFAPTRKKQKKVRKSVLLLLRPHFLLRLSLSAFFGRGLFPPSEPECECAAWKEGGGTPLLFLPLFPVHKKSLRRCHPPRRGGGAKGKRGTPTHPRYRCYVVEAEARMEEEEEEQRWKKKKAHSHVRQEGRRGGNRINT